MIKYFIFISGLISMTCGTWAVPVSITALSGLNFGTCIQGDSPKIILPQSSETSSNASFQVTGDPNAPITILLPTLPVTLTTGAGGALRTLTASTFISNPVGIGILNAAGVATIYVGATLSAVAAAQVSGTYNGNFSVTVVY